MNTGKNTDTKNLLRLANWIGSLKVAAKNDDVFSVSWFPDTKDESFSIVGGWMSGFSADYADLLCISKSNPEYAMCVKIVLNEGPYAYCDFETLNMPIDKSGEVDNTCIALEYDDDVLGMARFFMHELNRMNSVELSVDVVA